MGLAEKTIRRMYFLLMISLLVGNSRVADEM